jgi:cryptochrome
MESPRWKFIRSALNDIDEQLKKLGSRLHVLSGQPSEQLPVIFNEWNIVRLGFSAHPGCNESRIRDRAIVSLALRHGIEVVYREAPHCLFTPSDVLKQSNGQVPLTFKSFCSVIGTMELPAASVSVPESEIVMNSISEDHDEIEKNACLLSKDKDHFPWEGGETEARNRFDYALREWREKRSKQPDMRQVTPYIIQGCLSPRDVFHEIRKTYADMNGSNCSNELSLHIAQLHRDFLYCLGSIDKTNFVLNIQFDDNDLGDRWVNGKTGYPWVDSVVRQLRTEGWCAPLLRQSALWFLTRGMLWQKPEIGISFLSEHCLFDLPLAKGYVNWAAGIGAWIEDEVTSKCPAVNPDYIRQWCPELRHLSPEELAKPWLIKKNLPQDYPKICVPHKQSHKQSQAKYQLSLTSESNKFLTQLDHVGRSRKIHFPIRLEPNPWEIVQNPQFNNITPITPSFMQYVHKVSQATH